MKPDPRRRWLDASDPAWRNNPSRPVIFLDMDGVVVTMSSIKAGGSASADRVCVANLNRIVEETGAEIVISSSWRILRTIDFIRGVLCAAGFQHPEAIVDTTEHIAWQKEGGVIVGAAVRADEIREWLGRNPRERFVILDDDWDAEIAGHYVRTPSDTGLGSEHAARAVAILGTTVSWGWSEARGHLIGVDVGRVHDSVTVTVSHPDASPTVHGPVDHTPRCTTGGCKP